MKFIPNYANLSEPLRKLTRTGQAWEWTRETERSFQAMKEALVSEPCLSYFKLDTPAVVISDATQCEAKSWKGELPKILMAYRSTPHRASGETPAMLMFGRDIRIKCPNLEKAGGAPKEKETVADVRNPHKEYQTKMKQYADQTSRAKEHNFKV